MIDIVQISKRFGKLRALQDINLYLEKGECIAMIGPNGCGKTTLIKSILGMVLPESGTIMIEGKNIKGEVDYRRRIGYMPQIGRYPDNMTIGNIFEMIKGIRNYPDKLDEDLYYSFKLDQMHDKKMRALSGGTIQKVSAALAFLFNPDILILDEPTAGLDPLAAEILKEKITAKKNKGCLILITSHILSEMEDLVSQIIFMQEGSMIFHKSVIELKENTGHDTISRSIFHVLKEGMA